MHLYKSALLILLLRSRLRPVPPAAYSFAMVDQAQGMLMARFDLDPFSALKLLVTCATHHQVSLDTVCSGVIESCLVDPPPGASDVPPATFLAEALQRPLQ